MTRAVTGGRECCVETAVEGQQKDVMVHGACLGLGLAAMGTGRQDVYDTLRSALYQDDAVTGEAAGVAMGLVMLASNNSQATEDMVGYAQETAHEKTVRGLCVGISLLMYGRLEEAEPLISQLLQFASSTSPPLPSALPVGERVGAGQGQGAAAAPGGGLRAGAGVRGDGEGGRGAAAAPPRRLRPQRRRPPGRRHQPRIPPIQVHTRPSSLRTTQHEGFSDAKDIFP